LHKITFSIKSYGTKFDVWNSEKIQIINWPKLVVLATYLKRVEARLHLLFSNYKPKQPVNNSFLVIWFLVTLDEMQIWWNEFPQNNDNASEFDLPYCALFCSWERCLNGFLIFFFLCRWYQLKCKPGQNKNDYRGELEVRTAFTVKAVDTRDSDKLGSTAEISSKAKQGSLISLNKVSERMNCEESQNLHRQICPIYLDGKV
jgi:hypothetical protein